MSKTKGNDCPGTTANGAVAQDTLPGSPTRPPGRPAFAALRVMWSLYPLATGGSCPTPTHFSGKGWGKGYWEVTGWCPGPRGLTSKAKVRRAKEGWSRDPQQLKAARTLPLPVHTPHPTGSDTPGPPLCMGATLSLPGFSTLCEATLILQGSDTSDSPPSTGGHTLLRQDLDSTPNLLPRCVQR